MIFSDAVFMMIHSLSDRRGSVLKSLVISSQQIHVFSAIESPAKVLGTCRAAYCLGGRGGGGGGFGKPQGKKTTFDD